MADLDLVPAKRSAARFLIEYFKPRRCDSDGVSECVRCNVLALARWTLQDIGLHPGEGDNRAVSTEGRCSAATVSGTPESYSCSDPRQDARTPAGDGAPSPVLHAHSASSANADKA